MKVSEILETALYVADLNRTAEFHRRPVGFGALLESERLIALDVAGTSIVLLFPEGSTTEPFPVPVGLVTSSLTLQVRRLCRTSSPLAPRSPWPDRFPPRDAA
jgi:catechol-2,3-dioxygenase